MECGDCTACCKVLPIDDDILAKDSNVLCVHCDKGCTVYDDRPISCVNFNCVYIEDGYDESLRPDKTGVIFEKITTKIYLGLVDQDCLNTWNTIQMSAHIKQYNDQGISVVVSSFSDGIINVYCADDHKIDKVLQIALESNQ